MAQTAATHGRRPTPPAAELLGHTEWVRALARIIARDAATADDLAQETIAAALTGSPPTGAALRPWLAGTVRNLARLGRRRDAHRGAREREVARSGRADDHATVLAEAEAHQLVVEHVLALDERDRQVLLARYFQRLPLAEIARRDGRSVAAISSQLTRAHRNLRARLEAEGGRNRWLAGIAPLLMRSKGTAASIGTAWFAAASTWTLLAPIAVAVALGAFLLYQRPAPTGSAVDLVPTAFDDNVDDRGSADEVRLESTGSTTRTPSAPDGQGRALTSGSLLASVIAIEGTRIPEGLLRIEDSSGTVVADQALDTDGSAEFRALPADQTLRAFLSVAGARWPNPIAEFEVAPRERAKLLWSVFLTTRVELIGVDHYGAPAPHQTLGLVRTSAQGKQFATRARSKNVVQAGHSNEDGRVALEGVAPGRYGAGVLDYGLSTTEILPDGTRRMQLGKSPVNPGCPVTTPINVAPNTEQMEVRVPVHRGLRLKGHVVTEDGTPVQGVGLRATTDDVNGALEATSGEGGRFSFGNVVAGTYTIESEHSRDGWTLADPVEAESGTEDLLLTVGRAGVLKVTVTGVDTSDVWVWFSRIGTEATVAHGAGPHELTGGSFETSIGDVRPGPYWVSALDADGTHLGVVSPVHVAPGPELTRCTIHLARALEVEVINHDPSRAVRAHPKLDGFLLSGGYAPAGGRDVVAAPTGTSTFLVRFEGGPWQRHVIEGGAGERVTIEVGAPAAKTPSKSQPR